MASARPDRDDATLTAAGLAAFADAMPGEAAAPVDVITRGWDSLALRINQRWIVRVARRPEVDATLALEARLLPLIAAGVAPVRVPAFALARLDPPPAVAGYPLIPGQPLDEAGVPAWGEARVERLAAALGAFLTALHRIPATHASAAGLAPVTVEDWRVEYAGFRDWSRAEVAPRLAEPLRPRLERLWEAGLEEMARVRFIPVSIHRDLACEHVLLGPDGGLAGVIDWGDVALGDPAMDIAGFHAELGGPFARQVAARWDGPRAPGETTGTLLARASFYASLGPLHAIRFGLLTGADVVIRSGLASLTRALT